MDVAADAAGAPVVAYTPCEVATTRSATAAGTARAGAAHDIAPAGKTLFTYHNAGVRSTTPTPPARPQSHHRRAERDRGTSHHDHGATWSSVQLTHDSPSFNIRPVIPRGAAPGGRRVVLYVSGHARSFREYDTSVMMGIDDR